MMTENEEMTPAKAEALGEVSASVMQAIFNASHAHPDLTWYELAVATAVAMRGLAILECQKNPALVEDKANMMLMHAMAMAASMPKELIKIVNKDCDTSQPDTAGIIPVRRH